MAPGELENQIALAVNDMPTSVQVMPAGFRTYEWTVPVDAWRVGVNHVLLQVARVHIPAAEGRSHDARMLGVAIRSLRLELLDK